MNTTDEQLIGEMRAELDALVAGARDVPADPPPAPPNVAPGVTDQSRRWVAITIAAAAVAALVGGLVVVANRDAGDATSDTPPATSPSVPVTTAPVTTAATEPPTDIVPQVTQYVVQDPAIGRYEVIAPVLETAERGTQLCLGQWMISTTLPVCDGPELAGWSWDAVGGGYTVGTGRWVEAYVAGTWDSNAQVFTAQETHVPTDSDHARLDVTTPKLDNSVPCSPPAGGWPARNQEWPVDEVSAIYGYAGSWEDPTNQVVTVKFTGDLAAAEAAVRQHYGDNLCVVPAHHSAEQLVTIQNQLLGMSSVKWLWATVQVDATGEWVDVGVIAPDHDRQVAADAQYGDGVVRLTPRLQPL